MNMLDDWQRVKAVFEQALAVDETERSAFLAAACGSDALLRQRVDALLASHAASQSFLEAGASSVIDLRRPGEDLSGQRLGTYRLQSRIGAGAMGEVYPAHDEKLNRRVAVKLIAKAARRRCGSAAAISTGSACGFEPQPSEHRRRSRFRRAGWPPVHRHRAGRRGDAAGAAQGGAATDPRRNRDCVAGDQRIGGRPRAGSRPSRHQARERDVAAGRLREGTGFRAGEARARLSR